MKCETCNNEMVWKGSFKDGALICEYCENDDDCIGLAVRQLNDALAAPTYRGNPDVIVEVRGGGGGGMPPIGVPIPPPFGDCGDPDCDVCGPPKFSTIKVREERLPDGRIIRTPIYEDPPVKPYHNCKVAEAYMIQKRKEREQEQQAAMCVEAERQYRLKMEGEWDI